MLEIARFFHASDVLAVPYKRGSQSGVLQLAYAFGKASVATRVGSLPEVVVQDQTAALVPPSDAPALANALRELLMDPDAASRLGESARKYADEVLGWGPIARDTSALYSKLV
jgi:glycosyltransferase involved in cell wall biosynthesis